MIKDIVVNLSVGEKASPACDYAISVAAAFDAHLAGIAFLYDPIVPISGAGYIPADVIEAQERENEAATQRGTRPLQRRLRARRHLRRAADLQRKPRRRRRQFSRIARRFDLSIVGQAEPESSAVEEIIAEAALFESGRPVIIVPYIQKAPLKLDNVMVCWDGSRAAARAIADAMPLLSQGEARRGRHRRQRTRQAGRDRRRRYRRASGAARPQCRCQAHRPRRCRRCRRPVVARRRRRQRLHRHGRLRAFAPARIRARRRNAQHFPLDDRSGTDVALSRTFWPPTGIMSRLSAAE